LREVASLFPNGRCDLFKGAGHLAYYERPRRFNDLVMAFLRGAV
jgi:pimeloyl-ACP methyl ester carboxylesterase